MDKTIVVSNIVKKYKLYHDTKERILDLITPKSYGEDFYALANVNFEAEKGEVIGFVGVNGSGKSTLSNIIAGIVPETSGTVEVNGQVSLIAVAAGLKNDLTGRDNIELKLLMLGFSREEIKDLEPEIIEFSELGKFIDQPVKSYSSGMKSRLGFAISVNVDPEILIIDEALSVGDRAFAEKSLNKMKEFKEQGKTMIFVSHSLGQMRSFCDQILWLEYGMVKQYGPVDEVLPQYEAFLNRWQKMNKESREQYRQKALNYQQDVLADEADEERPYWLEAELEVEDDYREVFVSRVAQIKSGQYYIYAHPTELENKKSTKKYMGRLFYIKKRVDLNGQIYYLLSDQKSTTKGLIGWVKAEHIKSYLHLEIDEDPKIFTFTGTGVAYKEPWGGKKNKVFASLEKFRDEQFHVNKTEKVGRNIWYRGILEEKEVWIHSNHFVKEDDIDEYDVVQ